MIRYTFSSGQFTLLSLVIVIISTFFDCHEICENSGLATYSKLIFGNDSHEYSHYYYYFQTIRRNQPSPVVDEQFVKLAADEEVPLKFSFKFYGTNVSVLKIHSYGTIEMKIENGLGTIYTDLEKGGVPEYQISNEKELLAVRSIFHRNIDGKNVELKVLNLIHPSGKISVYYENVSEEIRENELESVVNRQFLCQTIRRNQPSPVVDEQFVKLAADEEVPLKFSFKFYGTNVSVLKIHSYGTIEMKIENGLGTIYTDLEKGGVPEYQISNET
ncbi:hypothetical protein MS3_00010252 [Schistosoma haematobium]|uniref:Uncharacterized protein n=1 Tax=Schistosoma haematobium TaxID=6185 RepID=A0A922M071_SCHHA|nr:hypothetical protein MS3_00010252 [Schistosoma haematobium]KAH9596993.1 hypothetical protein MS3_00010252 [Schistosoma haematobium]